jgi:allantoin racemase
MKKILYINPVGTNIFDKPMKDFLEKYKDDETVIEVTSFSRGPQHLEYYSYDAIIMPDLLKTIKKAEKEGYDAAIIGCFYDPGLHEAREISEKIIVTAPAESSFHIASTLGDKFAVIVGRKKWIPLMERNVRNYGFKDKLVSFKSVELGVYDFHKDVEETKKRIVRASQEAIEEGAEVIILGCTVLFGFFEELQKILGVPVVDPIIAALKYAEFLIDLKRKAGWFFSKKYSYEPPPTEEILKWNLSELQ